MGETLAYDLDSLAVDVFELAENDLTVESLTGGHGMTEMAASVCVGRHVPCSASCCCGAPEA